MKQRIFATIALVVTILGAWRLGRAQSMISGGPFQFQVPGLHTACTVVLTSTQFCFAGDGLWESIAGAPYVEVKPSTVTSVNGKTGAVTLTVTSTIQ